MDSLFQVFFALGNSSLILLNIFLPFRHRPMFLRSCRQTIRTMDVAGERPPSLTSLQRSLPPLIICVFSISGAGLMTEIVSPVRLQYAEIAYLSSFPFVRHICQRQILLGGDP